ncbi:MAG: hypothetical protein ACOX1Q_09100 [Eubacteriales bacterium]
MTVDNGCAVFRLAQARTVLHKQGVMRRTRMDCCGPYRCRGKPVPMSTANGHIRRFMPRDVRLLTSGIKSKSTEPRMAVMITHLIRLPVASCEMRLRRLLKNELRKGS